MGPETGGGKGNTNRQGRERIGSKRGSENRPAARPRSARGARPSPPSEPPAAFKPPASGSVQLAHPCNSLRASHGRMP